MNHTDNGFAPMENWTPPAHRGDRLVFLVACLLAVLVLGADFIVLGGLPLLGAR